MDFPLHSLFHLDDSTPISHLDEDWQKLLRFDLQDFLSSPKFAEILSPESEDGNFKLKCGIACLLAFIQANFTGPELDFEPAVAHVKGSLDIDGEEPNVNVRNEALLVAAKALFETATENSLVSSLWRLRSLVVHQKVMEEYCISLYEAFSRAVAEVTEALEGSGIDEKNRFLIETEIIQGFLVFRRVSEAQSRMESLVEEFQIDVEVSAALGMRTKFQTKAVPQLTLNVEVKRETPLFESSEVTHSSTALPKLLALDDDVRLEKVQFIHEEEGAKLNSCTQILVLTKLKILQMSQPKDNLSDEEVSPFIAALLDQEFGPWLVRFQTLLTKIKQESRHKRTVERSLKQCEDLLHLLQNPTPEPSKRTSLLFASYIQPRWTVELQLGELMMSLGMIKTALDLYIKLQEWEDVILCYTALQLRHKAAEVIRQELEKQPTVKLYCLLGDATDDVGCYEKAWELSGQKSGRAQRHWGNFYFAKKEYERAIPYLERTLQLNSLQEIQWLRLGYAALSLERWELAAKAYRHYTHLEPNGFESWNNLAKAYIKLGDKRRAHAVLQESLKCNFNNWKVWENFLLVSIDVGSFEDAINAYSQVSDLKQLKQEKYYDAEVLEIIARAILNDLEDCYGNPTKRLTKKFLQLLAQQLGQRPMEANLWELSARLTEEPLQRAEKFQKAYRGYSSGSWTKEEASCAHVVDLCVDLAESSLEATKDIKDAEKSRVLSQLSSARLAAQGCAKVARSQGFEGLSEKLAGLEALVETMTSSLKSLK